MVQDSGIRIQGLGVRVRCGYSQDKATRGPVDPNSPTLGISTINLICISGLLEVGI